MRDEAAKEKAELKPNANESVSQKPNSKPTEPNVTAMLKTQKPVNRDEPSQTTT
jgi:hypothetical protein